MDHRAESVPRLFKIRAESFTLFSTVLDKAGHPGNGSTAQREYGVSGGM